jgi:alkylated DNA repair dioxygenase AlkB
MPKASMTTEDDRQPPLFAGLEPTLPDGARYQSEFLSCEQEAEMIALIQSLPLAAAQYKSYEARRRVLSFGGRFDDTNRLLPGPPLIEALCPLRQQVAEWLGQASEALEHALVAEYSPGTPLGWHRDVPDFEEIAGVSLGAPAILRFRRYPPSQSRPRDILRLSVAPRSIYHLQGPSRWAWQHSVAPVQNLRWSITFRTRRQQHHEQTR